MLLGWNWFAIERIQQWQTYMCLEELICPCMSQKHTNMKIQKNKSRGRSHNSLLASKVIRIISAYDGRFLKK